MPILRRWWPRCLGIPHVLPPHGGTGTAPAWRQVSKDIKPFEKVQNLYPEWWRERWSQAFQPVTEKYRRKGPRTERTKAERAGLLDAGQVGFYHRLFRNVLELNTFRQPVDPRPFWYYQEKPLEHPEYLTMPKSPLLDHLLGSYWIWVKAWREDFMSAQPIHWMLVNLRGYVASMVPLSIQRTWVTQAVGRPAFEFYNAWDECLDLLFQFEEDVDVSEVVRRVDDRLRGHGLDPDAGQCGVGPNHRYPVCLPLGFGSFRLASHTEREDQELGLLFADADEMGPTRTLAPGWSSLNNTLIELARLTKREALDEMRLSWATVSKNLGRGQWKSGGRGRPPRSRSGRGQRRTVSTRGVVLLGRDKRLKLAQGRSVDKQEKEWWKDGVPDREPLAQASAELHRAASLKGVAKTNKMPAVRKIGMKWLKDPWWSSLSKTLAPSLVVGRFSVFLGTLLDKKRWRLPPVRLASPNPVSRDEIRFILSMPHLSWRRQRLLFSLVQMMMPKNLDEFLLTREAFLEQLEGTSSRNVREDMEFLEDAGILQLVKEARRKWREARVYRVASGRLRQLVRMRYAVPARARYSSLEVGAARVLDEDEIRTFLSARTARKILAGKSQRNRGQ